MDNVYLYVMEPAVLSKNYYAQRLETLAFMVRERAPLMLLHEQAINLVVDAALHGQRITNLLEKEDG